MGSALLPRRLARRKFHLSAFWRGRFYHLCLDIRTSEPTKTQKDNGADTICSVILQQLFTAYCLGTHAGVPLLAWPGADQLAVVGRLVVTFGGPAIHHVAVGVLHHSGDAGVEAILRVLYVYLFARRN